ncbi:MAG: 2-oxoglutarate dehydrogenase E1 component [Anaerolineales bacterium]|nr:2-oxoglutarate dehydrogenase E1 component [Anaerolineales bacterium]MCZ2120662.1 2-oxoglutarate dehydrogenase E1 component [Anaerolineales bacterium]
MSFEHEFYGPNLGYILELYDRYQNDPHSVDEEARQLFQNWKPTSETQSAPQSQSLPELNTLIRIATLAQAIREYGYLAAKLDPLGEIANDPILSLDFYNLREADLRKLPADIIELPAAYTNQNAYQAIETLRSIYSGTIGYDYDHIRLPEERAWLYQTAEAGNYRQPQYKFDENKLLERLTEVEAFEKFLHRVYPGKTRFSIEGLDMLIPMLDEVIQAAAQAQIENVVIGMGHRGRLNILAHILHKPYAEIMAEFKDPQRATTWSELGWTGDVKYHMGASRAPQSEAGINLTVRMPANPSHLEQIDPVLQGIARALNTSVNQAGAPEYSANASLPILIHGDAAFSGQGIVAEVLNFSRLPGYTTSGTIHIVANNQVGFTTSPNESRSSLHASDLAKGYEIPVIHVNADDPSACFEALQTAFAYRQKFQKDFVINLIGYRRYGHNEGDEPRFTQPIMYKKIDAHPTLRQLWSAKLEANQRLQTGQAEALLQNYLKQLQDVNDQLDAKGALKEPIPQPPPQGAAQKVKTAISKQTLSDLNQALLKFPEGFKPNSKLEKAVEKRKKLLDGNIEWATAEELAFASILNDGIPIRLTGQDAARGTFSQRHAVFYDSETNQGYSALQHIPQAKAAFEIINSPLSEMSVIGFEFGYNVQAPERLVIWEAQYGDFINNAQAIIDEFILSGRAKWGLTPSLVFLLPHGNEGQGPDHSSARIERFLGLAAETNVRIAYPSTAAQYFHLLRRQALLLKTDPLPLIVFTPKGMLRHPLAASTPDEFINGAWQSVIDDTDSKINKKKVETLILCSGRIYADLVGNELRKATPTAAIARLEQLYPFPRKTLEALLAKYPNLKNLVWAQEEPRNMGAWDYLRPLFRQLSGETLSLYYVGRPESSSPSEGSSTLYRINQQALVEQAFKFKEQTHLPSVVKERG